MSPLQRFANSYSDLIRHYETKHSSRKQEFICPHCDDRKSFSRSDALRYNPSSLTIANLQASSQGQTSRQESQVLKEFLCRFCILDFVWIRMDLRVVLGVLWVNPWDD